MSGPVPCRSCGQPVPPGRLACPACGTLVAQAAEAPAEPEGASPAAAPSSPDADATQPEAPAAADALHAAEPEPAADDSTPAADATLSAEEWPSAPAPIEAWAPKKSQPPTPVAEAAPPRDAVDPSAAAAADAVTSGGILPGAYLPPSTVHRPAVATGGGDVAAETSPPGSGAGWPIPASTPRAPSSTGSGQWVPPTPAVLPAALGSQGAAGTPPSRPLVPGRTSILADLPFDAPADLEGWLVALGGIVAILGFFLPWTASLGTGFEGYFGSWGLGIVSHLPMFLFLVIVTGLAILPNRVATWVRTGVCGMVGGGILFGLVWLYLGSDASQLGALLAAVGAVLLVVGGIIAVAPGRSKEHIEAG